ncbi:MAG: DUF2294 family protein [Firmicutes bacterium]|nr:DUF2294 family protein [Bacillota bacterium]
MNIRTKGQLEDGLRSAFTRLHARTLGRGPKDVCVKVYGNFILVLWLSTITSVEKVIRNQPDGIEKLRRIRKDIIRASIPEFQQIIDEYLGAKIITACWDINMERNDRYLLIVIDKDVDYELKTAGVENISSTNYTRVNWPKPNRELFKVAGGLNEKTANNL